MGSGGISYPVFDILWVLVCSGLVFLMQPGFMCLESGLTRSKKQHQRCCQKFCRLWHLRLLVLGLRLCRHVRRLPLWLVGTK